MHQTPGSMHTRPCFSKASSQLYGILGFCTNLWDKLPYQHSPEGRNASIFNWKTAHLPSRFSGSCIQPKPYYCPSYHWPTSAGSALWNRYSWIAWFRNNHNFCATELVLQIVWKRVQNIPFQFQPPEKTWTDLKTWSQPASTCSAHVSLTTGKKFRTSQ